MKISLNWVFDHIKGELSRIDVAQLVDTFIRTTAEIEGWKKVTLDTQDLTLVEVVAADQSGVKVHSAERKKDYLLPARADAVVGALCIIVDKGDTHHWATIATFGGVKDTLLPALDVGHNLRAGGWKSAIEIEDYIVEVDNKSINSRPDLWSHRGIAREIAAILDLQLRPLNEFIIRKDVAHADEHSPITVAIADEQACTRFAALYMPHVTPKGSQLSTVIRLSRLDSRSIDLLVDATNYVMLDLGQPMHAFDADKLSAKTVTVTRAQPKEKLSLLDGETIELTSEDVVVADGGKAISLAGIMGGSATGISAQTTSVLIESAHFEPVTLRRTSGRHKKRTESSMRFEKSLDPHQNTDALKRYLFLLDAAGLHYKANERIVSLGNVLQPKTITINHSFIEARLGILIQPERIVTILNKLEFEVVQGVEHDEVMYVITVPTFRATKDVKIPEDIVEEIGRYVGYDTIPRVMPSLQLRPSDLHNTYTVRKIKRFLSYGLMMHELYCYSFFDESVLRELAWQPKVFVGIKNPISENYTRLVTTLQPHLLKAVKDNSTHYAQLRFFEWGRVWHKDIDTIVEQKSVSGIFFDRSGFDFYTGKAMLVRMLQELHIDVTWSSNQDNDYPWLSAHQTAVLMHDNKPIGVAGMVDDAVVSNFSVAGGAAFMFELNADFLLSYKRPKVRFEPLSKYPSVRRDVSMLIPVAVTTDALTKIIKAVDKRIENVTLIDFFAKPEWKDQKAITFHVEMCDKDKTFVAEEVEQMWAQVIAQLQEQGAVIR